MQCVQRGQQFRTFDWEDHLSQQPLALHMGLQACAIVGDLWGAGGSAVRLLLDNDDWHPLLLLCDNGAKPLEMATFVPLLRAGDIVGVHDWGTEVNEGDIDPVRALLTPYLLETCESIDSMLRFWTVK